MVGTAGFEPATTTPPVWCATRLRYAPKRPILELCTKDSLRILARKPFHSHAALKTDSITHLYNINSFFPCVFVSPDSEIIFRAKVSVSHATLKMISIIHLYNINSFFPCVFVSPDSEIIFRAKVSVSHATLKMISIIHLYNISSFFSCVLPLCKKLNHQRPIKPGL